MKRLPIGIDNFEKLISNDYYYVDKTSLIREVAESDGEVTLYTRPRRFGKTLNMSMLKSFFEIGSRPELFSNLEISKDTAFCEKYEGKYPVISISLKDVNGLDFEEAFLFFCKIIYFESNRYSFLSESDRLSESEKENFESLLNLGNPYIKSDKNNIAILANSLYMLTSLLCKYYGHKVVVLIDEYDVPLDKAHAHGYYDEMVDLIRNMFHAALKTNENLAFAVLTGCLRVSKESIFTGMNNLSVNAITVDEKNVNFGFTKDEVDELLAFYDLSGRKQEVKDWYDGYRFGASEVYCPWDVLNFTRDIYLGYRNEAVSYWANTSSNDLVRDFVSIASEQTSAELERLMQGEKIIKKIREDLTYRDIGNTIDDLWSVLYLTGYLTGQKSSEGEDFYELWIPNKEVRVIYENDIIDWFKGYVRADHEAGDRFYRAALSENPKEMESVLCDLLFDSISIRDTYSRKEYRENFYHGFVLGLLTGFPGIMSNSEAGNGYSDIEIRDKKNRTVAILELKYSDSDSDTEMEYACDDALDQIEDKKYAEKFTRNNVFKKVIKYGIAFNKKQARVKMG